MAEQQRHTVLMPSTASPRVDWLEAEALSRLMDTPSSLSALFQGCRVCSSSHSVATCGVLGAGFRVYDLGVWVFCIAACASYASHASNMMCTVPAICPCT